MTGFLAQSNGSGQSCNEEHVLGANSPQQQNGNDMSRPLKGWTDEEYLLMIDSGSYPLSPNLRLGFSALLGMRCS
ncbi:hypothetical protein RHMOL_Rhmol04G0271500 [Rhododendron molle]|uniref:Uncharacterized protein n=1 Tax=Rhododendron molle TaxID=49168 RepID=A0ACC0P647_RHOML|nr:hypothetical protein RHMOL_Rhmol04G0271500 [Rhododendron molle]